jgi:hypothetical protein
VLNLPLKTNGDKAWFGWPKDDKLESLRGQWLNATTTDERKKIAAAIQERAFEVVPYLPTGQWLLDFVAWIRGAGAFGAAVFVAAYVAACVLFLPGSILTLGAGSHQPQNPRHAPLPTPHALTTAGIRPKAPVAGVAAGR